MNEQFMKERPILPLLTSMALPMVVSMLVNSLYNIVDSFFVARISEDAMTALSLVYPIQNFVNAAAIGFGVGMNALIAFHLGAGEKDRASTAATHGLTLSAVHGLVLMVGCIAVLPAFLGLFTRDPAVLDLGVRYGTIVFLFSVVIMLGLAFEKIFQAVGRMKVTMAALISGCLTNILLDPVMIFGLGPVPAMGIAGAALATGIGQVVSLAVYLVVYAVAPPPVRLGRAWLRPDLRLDARLYAIGVPAILNLALPSLLVSVLNSLLAAFSQSYVVILGIYYKLQTFLYLPASGIVQGMRPIIGYNYGAREYGRVRKIFSTTLVMCAAIMLLGTLLCLAGAEPLIALFTDNPETVALGGQALRILCAGFLVSTVSVAASGALEGLGKGAQSLIISLMRYVAVMIPAAFLLCRLMGPTGVWHAFWVTEAVTALAAGWVYRQTMRRSG
ncbi:MAG TPA: MATE family efflux transporter [Candidatus Gemmiger stercoravium]|nr:MATE family efflux transporter [Candidatus Gemmiger stercoravium]